jgi:hypothetical protein
MSAVLERTKRPKPAPQKRVDWAAWRMDEEEVRVQVNRPDLAKAFAKVKSVRQVGAGMRGNYLKLFHINQTVPWVDAWMKEFIHQASTCEAERKAVN